MELEKLWGSIRTSDVYDYVPEEYKQQSALPSEIYDEAFKKMKVNDIAKIQALVDREVAAARIDEVWLAKSSQAIHPGYAKDRLAELTKENQNG